MKHLLNFQVYLLYEPRFPKIGDRYERVCTLYDGYAEFFVPLFDSINSEYGRDIVFSNGVTFGNDDLKILSQILNFSKIQISDKGESWEVNMNPHEKGKNQTYCRVTKSNMITVLDKIEAARKKAMSNNAYVSFNFWGNGG